MIFVFIFLQFSEELITFAMPQLLRFVGCVRLANGMMLLWSRASGEERVQTAALFSQAFVSGSACRVLISICTVHFATLAIAT